MDVHKHVVDSLELRVRQHFCVHALLLDAVVLGIGGCGARRVAARFGDFLQGGSLRVVTEINKPHFVFHEDVVDEVLGDVLQIFVTRSGLQCCPRIAQCKHGILVAVHFGKEVVDLLLLAFHIAVGLHVRAGLPGALVLGGSVVGGGFGAAQVSVVREVLFHHMDVVNGLVVVVVDEEAVDAGEAGHVAQARELLFRLHKAFAAFIGKLAHQAIGQRASFLHVGVGEQRVDHIGAVGDVGDRFQEVIVWELIEAGLHFGTLERDFIERQVGVEQHVEEAVEDVVAVGGILVVGEQSDAVSGEFLLAGELVVAHVAAHSVLVFAL